MMKCSNFHLGIKVIVFGSKYTGSSPKIAFLSCFARCSHSCFVAFFLGRWMPRSESEIGGRFELVWRSKSGKVFLSTKMEYQSK